MAISLHTAGTWVAANATTQTVTLPTHSAGDMLIVRVGFKHATMPTDVTCGTAGWAKLGQDNSGTTASGNGTGSVEIAVFWKEATSGAETNPVITFNGGSVAATPSAACCQVYQKASTEQWVTPQGVAGNISVATNFSATMESHISATTGDLIDAFVVTNDNTTLTVPTFTQTGLTLDAVTESPAAALSSATSNDISADGCFRKATAGTSSAAAVVTGTNSVADEGIAWTTRLRVEPIPAPSGTGAVTVPAATVSGTGSLGITGTGGVSLLAPTVAGTGVETFTATGAVSLPAATVSGTATETFTATGAVSLAAVTVAGTGEHTQGEVEPSGTGAISLPSTTVEGTGSLGLTATGAVALPAVTVDGTGSAVLTMTGTGDISLAVATVAGSGIGGISGTASVGLASVVVAGEGTRTGGVEVGGRGGRVRLIRPVRRRDDDEEDEEVILTVPFDLF